MSNELKTVLKEQVVAKEGFSVFLKHDSRKGRHHNFVNDNDNDNDNNRTGDNISFFLIVLTIPYLALFIFRFIYF